MTVDHECDFPDTCNVCRGPARPERRRPVVIRRMTARYPGDCRECGLGIYEGQDIALVTTCGWMHVDCAEDLT